MRKYNEDEPDPCEFEEDKQRDDAQRTLKSFKVSGSVQKQKIAQINSSFLDSRQSGVRDSQRYPKAKDFFSAFDDETRGNFLNDSPPKSKDDIDLNSDKTEEDNFMA